MNKAEFYLEDLKSKFKKIDPKKYYLSYSGGRDSHLLYWFLKVWLLKNDFKMWLEYKNIPIVSVNTRMEHPEILRRIIDKSDTVLMSKLKPNEVKEKVGSPCFSKQQDDHIDRYQRGSRAPSTMEVILGTKNDGKSQYKMNKKASSLLLSDNLHKISAKCCDELKKKPLKLYEKQNNLKPIIGIRGSESKLREAQYGNVNDDDNYGEACFTKTGKFTPLHDLDNKLFEKINKQYNIPKPSVYNYISQSGCMACPYGSWKGHTKLELDLLSKNKRKWVIDYFKESYDVLGIEYQTRQQNIFDLEEE